MLRDIENSDAREDLGADVQNDMFRRIAERDRKRREAAGLDNVFIMAAQVYSDHLRQKERVFADAVREHYAKYEKKIRIALRKNARKTSAKAKLRVETMRRLQEIFANDDSEHDDLPFSMFLDFSDAIAGIKTMSRADLNKIVALITSGRVLYENQIRTMVNCLFTILLNPRKSFVVIGAVQSGKSGIGIAMIMFMAPIIYRLTGTKIRPIFTSTNQKSHVSQTKEAFKRALLLYGHGKIVYAPNDEDNMSMSEYFVELMPEKKSSEESVDFQDQPTPKQYIEIELNVVPAEEIVDSFIFIRAPGKKGVQAIRAKMAEAEARNEIIWMIVDEPQYGASGDDVVEHEDGRLTGCIMKQILGQFEDANALTPESRHLFIGVTATAFELADLDDFEVVWAYLSKDYMGFNCFPQGGVGRKIDPEVYEHRAALGLQLTPHIIAFPETGIRDVHHLKTLFAISNTKSLEATEEELAALGYTVETARARAMQIILEISDKYREIANSIIFLRIASNNRLTEEVLRDSGIERTHNILRFHGDEYHFNGKAGDVREAIEGLRNSPEFDPAKAIMIVATGKARMGDDFPPEVELFFDLTRKPSDMTAAIQGTAGRACGHHKRSKVFVSPEYAEMIRNYIDSDGEDFGSKPSRHTVEIGDQSGSARPRGRPPGNGRIGYYESAQLPWVKAFLADINALLRKRHPEKVTDLRAAGQMHGTRKNEKFGVPLALFDKHNFWENVRNPEFARLIDPKWTLNFVKPGEILHTVRRDKDTGAEVPVDLVWPMIDAQTVFMSLKPIRDTYSASVESRNSRRKSKINSGDEEANWLNIQLGYVRVDDDGRVIEDVPGQKPRPGYVQAATISIPLHGAIPHRRQRNRPNQSYVVPKANSPYDAGLRPNGLKRKLRDDAVAARAKIKRAHPARRTKGVA